MKASIALLSLTLFTLAACSTNTQIHPIPQSDPETQAPQIHKYADPPETCALCRVYADVRPSVVKVDARPILGAGVVIDKTGRIVTNAHVVRNLKKVTVTFYGGEEREAQVIKRDPKLDLALLSVDDPPDGLTELAFNSDAAVREGQEVIVIGHPIGFEWTITRGIVSGMRGPHSTRFPNMIQTDAGISPGNSGGPLLTVDGQLIGIVTSKVRGGGAENLGFARPASIVLEFIAQAKQLSP